MSITPFSFLFYFLYFLLFFPFFFYFFLLISPFSFIYLSTPSLYLYPIPYLHQPPYPFNPKPTPDGSRTTLPSPTPSPAASGRVHRRASSSSPPPSASTGARLRACQPPAELLHRDHGGGPSGAPPPPPMLAGGGARPPPISPHRGRSPRGASSPAMAASRSEEAVHGSFAPVRSSAGPASLALICAVAGHLRPLHYAVSSGRLEAAVLSAAAPSSAVASLPAFITESCRPRPSSASPATANHLPAPLQPPCPDGVHRG
jgi:hypothetical protein